MPELKSKVFRLLTALIVGVFLFYVVYDFFQLPTHRYWSEKYRLFWYAGLAGMVLFYLIVLACLWVYLTHPDRFRAVMPRLIRFRQRLGLWRWVIAIPVALLPAVFTFFTTPGWMFTSLILRLTAWLGVGLLLAFLITHSDQSLVEAGSAAFSLLLLGTMHVIAYYLAYVTPYPFSLSWSEGNRLYDYSVMLGSSRYQYPGVLTIPYFAPGRYLLWGILFAIPGTPIWLHRLWDAILWLAPPMLLGYLVARWSRLPRLAIWCFILWAFLFLYQGPVYTPLVLSAILVVLVAHQKRWWLAAIGVALAAYYAALSRWTWVAAPTIWAVMIMIPAVEPLGKVSWSALLRRLLPIAGVALAGLAGGLLSNPEFFTPQEIGALTMLKQPLLWYRLLPNATNSSGILLSALLAAGPLIAGLCWAAASRWWRVSWLQGLVYLAAGLATLLVGLTASVKIGGGSNLHNLDMFLVTLVILSGLALQGRQETGWQTWPVAGRILLVLVLALPTIIAIRIGEQLHLPLPDSVGEALQTVQAEVERAKQSGEVLFIDQRQLLTFGAVRDVPLVAEYEKKYMMDMAMGNNQAYFDAFYTDLRRQRFKLIVSDVLRAPKKEDTDSFGEESNAWVKWVVKPVLCYYQPVETFEDVRVQLLEPVKEPLNCP